MQRDTALPLNVGGVATAEQEAMQRDIEHRTENWGKDALNDKLTNDKTPPPAWQRNTAAKPQSSNDRNGLTSPGGDNNAKATGSNTNSTPQGFGSAPVRGVGGDYSNPRTAGGSSPSTPASMSIYRNLMQRGRSLSQPGAAASNTASVGGGDSDGDSRLKKDPVGSYGYGSSPVRFPMGSAPYAAGGGGQGPSAQGYSPTSGTLGGGLGSVQRYTPAELPRLQRGMGNSSYAAPPDTDPASRTYDPSKESTDTYGGH